VFIDEYVGLSTRLETLAMAFLISERFGHQVCLDWSELDSFHVEGARREKCGLWGRVDSIKLRDYSPQRFERIARHAHVRLRTHQGPSDLLSRLYLPTARRVKLRRDLVQTIRDTFERYKERPVVGVHIRGGDFRLVNPDEFDVTAAEWPAVPLWWYEHVMRRIQTAFPDVAFFVSCTGSLQDFPNLTQNFDVFDLPTSFPYTYKGPDHASRRHPAADLFALGCCSVIVGSPCSTFTHYAAHMLGEPSTVLVPPASRMVRQLPAFSQLSLYGRSAFDWYAACRQGAGLSAVDDPRAALAPGPARLGWM
jgi:hypothetical protein